MKKIKFIWCKNLEWNILVHTEILLPGWFVKYAKPKTELKNVSPPSHINKPCCALICGASKSKHVSGATPSFQITSSCSWS